MFKTVGIILRWVQFLLHMSCFQGFPKFTAFKVWDEFCPWRSVLNSPWIECESYVNDSGQEMAFKRDWLAF